MGRGFSDRQRKTHATHGRISRDGPARDAARFCSDVVNCTEQVGEIGEVAKEIAHLAYRGFDLELRFEGRFDAKHFFEIRKSRYQTFNLVSAVSSSFVQLRRC